MDLPTLKLSYQPKQTNHDTMTMQTETRRPTITMTVGGPGSGKGFTINRMMPDATVLDCDSIKAEHPDYDPKDPGALHAWSRTEMTRRFFTMLGEGNDFVYDGTGTNVERYVTWINAAHDAGFNVHILYVTCSLATALVRNANRTRNVPESIVREKHSTVAVAFEILSRYADTVQVVNNN